MIKGCENCKYALYDNVPWGMGSTSYLSGCTLEDKMALELPGEDLDAILEGSKDCPYWEACNE